MKQNILIGVSFAGVLAAAAQGGVIGNAITITADNGSTAGQWQIDNSAIQWDAEGRWSWSSSGPLTIRDGSNNPVATLDSLSLGYQEDPVVSVSFAVTASGTPTLFTISSGLLAFPGFIGEARASSTFTLTDNDGDGASMFGAFGGSAYRANLNGAIPGPTPFAFHNPSMGAGSFSSNTSNMSTPFGPGFTPVGFISSQQAAYSFTLSANDSASGTSVFVTRVPTPASMMIVGLAGVLGGRRRR
jgi:hypothetical protein